MKRTFDIVAALAGVITLSPVIAIVAIAIVASDGLPVLYLGERVGRGGRRFRMAKFRTMIKDAAKLGGTSTPEDDPRLTRVGRVLRRYKIDEMPQLFNVLAGDMSFVGPRPQVPWAVERYSADERRLLDVRPGITDYASIRFQNEAEILRGSLDPDKDYLEKIAPEKIRLGLEYVSTRSMRLDLRIIVATLWSMAGGDPDRVLGHSRT